MPATRAPVPHAQSRAGALLHRNQSDVYVVAESSVGAGHAGDPGRRYPTRNRAQARSYTEIRVTFTSSQKAL
jgi:hypothetical protein